MKMVLFIENLTIHQNPRTTISSPRQTEETKAWRGVYTLVRLRLWLALACYIVRHYCDVLETSHSGDTDINTYILTNADTNTDTSTPILIPVQRAIAMF